jgi:hypothetical protein
VSDHRLFETALAIFVVFSRVFLTFSIGIQASQGRILLVYWCPMDAQIAVAVDVWFTAMFSAQSVRDAASSVMGSIPISPLSFRIWGRTITDDQ